MKQHLKKSILSVLLTSCILFTVGCGTTSLNSDYDDDKNAEVSVSKSQEDETSFITEYKWQGAKDGSLMVFEPDGNFKYYRYADDLDDNYYYGTYVFNIGSSAVQYLTTDLADNGVTADELQTIFDNNEGYDESNFVCLVLNNEACIIDGENQVENPYQTPYFGFCLEDTDGTLVLDLANMNTGNYSTFIAK
ncbi:MAG: hypothetical protein J6J79_07885 [Lachnospiraceae bacterium]|nr:hypothetical protein [Lachnospiraceae bacterium]